MRATYLTSCRSSLTYKHWDPTNASYWNPVTQNYDHWAPDSQITYYYYGINESYGLACDLKAVATQYWNNTTSTWTGNDTIYYRYYKDAADGIGFAHGLMRELLPATFNSLANSLLGH